MKNNAIIREIRKQDPAAFRALHHILGFDFESKFHALKIPAPFTMNKIWKLIESKGYTGQTRVALLMTGGRVCFANDLTLFKITGPGNSDFDVNVIRESRRWPRFNTKVKDVWCKGDFNERRKNPETTAYIICQSLDHITELKPESRPDFSDIFTRLTPEEQKKENGRAAVNVISAVEMASTEAGAKEEEGNA